MIQFAPKWGDKLEKEETVREGDEEEGVAGAALVLGSSARLFIYGCRAK